jgi:hypothetical protein
MSKDKDEFVLTWDSHAYSKILSTDKDEFVPTWDSHAYSKILSTEEYNEIEFAELKKHNWDKPLKYDEDGRVIWPNCNELTKNTIDKKFDTISEEDLKKLKRKNKIMH